MNHRSTMLLALTVILGVMNGSTLRAQAQSDLRFEVASVRRVEIPTVNGGVPVFPITGGIGSSDPRRIGYRATWLSGLIAHAFDVRSDQIVGPELGGYRYDIVANIPAGTTKEQFKIMLGNLLRDRFKLRFRVGSSVRPVYILRVGKNGPKFKEAISRRGDDATPSSGAVRNDAEGFPTLPPDYRGLVGNPSGGDMRLAAQDIPIADFARFIEPSTGRPVMDETMLAGRYDLKIRFEWLRRSANAGAALDSAPSLFTAVEEQLGLKLEPASRPFPQLIIDSIDREPTEN